MNFLITFLLVCLASSNAMYSFFSTQQNVNLLLNSQSFVDDNFDFNEIEALDQFLKGILKGAGVAIVGDSTACLKGDAAISLFEYYYGLFLAASTSGSNQGIDSMRLYLNSAGTRRIRNLPISFMNCLTSSQDFKNLQAKLKVDPSGDVFGAAFSAYSISNPAYFQISCSDIYASMSTGNFAKAGMQFGIYAKTVALRCSKN